MKLLQLIFLIVLQIIINENLIRTNLSGQGINLSKSDSKLNSIMEDSDEPKNIFSETLQFGLQQKINSHPTDVNQIQNTCQDHKQGRQARINSTRMKNRNSFYDLEAIPPCFERAQAHRKATAVGLEKNISNMNEDEEIQYCGCCARQVDRKSIDLYSDIFNLSFLGSGYPLYFSFMKQCIILLCVVLFFSGIFNVITNILSSSKCADTQAINETICKKQGNWVSVFSLGSKSDQKVFMEVQGYLNLASLVAMIFLLQFFRKLQRELDIQCDTQDIAANDYTIMISNIPIEFQAINDDYDDDIKDFLEKNCFKNKKVEIQSVILCYNLNELTKIQSSKSSLIEIRKIILQKVNSLERQFLKINKQAFEGQKDPKDFKNDFGMDLPVKNKNDTQFLEQDNHLKNDRNTGKQQIITNNSQNQFEQNNTFNNSIQNNPQNTKQLSIIILRDKLVNERDKFQIPSNSSNKGESKQNQPKKIVSKKIIEILKQKEDAQKRLVSIDQKLRMVNLSIKQLTNRLMEGKGSEFMKQYFTGIAFVSLKNEEDKEEIIERYKNIKFEDQLFTKVRLTENKLIYSGNKINIIQAPDPTDVKWRNLHYKEKEKSRRRILSFFFTAACLLLCAFLIYLFLLLQENQINNEEDSNSLKLQVISACLAIFISVLNFILTTILKISSNYCKYFTQTDVNIFIAKGLSVARFINSAIISFIIQLFVTSKQNKTEILFGKGGLSENANYFMISNCFVPALMQLINIPYYVHYFIRKHETLLGIHSVLTQAQLNSLYQDPEFPIEERYGQLLMTMFTTAFYCPIVPLTIIWSIIGITLQYWVDKFNLIKRSSVSFNMSADLSIEMTEQLEYFLPIQSVSALIFFSYANGGSWGTSSIIGTILGFVHAFLPMQLINERIFQLRKGEPNQIDYENASNAFITDYNRENPVYQENARKNHVQKMTIRIENKKSIMKTRSLATPITEKTQTVESNLLNFIPKNPERTFPTIQFNSMDPENHEEYNIETEVETGTQTAFEEDQRLNSDNIRRKHFISIKMLTNETNLYLIEEEEQKSRSPKLLGKIQKENKNVNIESIQSICPLSSKQVLVRVKQKDEGTEEIELQPKIPSTLDIPVSMVCSVTPQLSPDTIRQLNPNNESVHQSPIEIVDQSKRIMNFKEIEAS